MPNISRLQQQQNIRSFRASAEHSPRQIQAGSKLQPTGQVQPVACLCTAYELQMVFMFLWVKKINMQQGTHVAHKA